MYVILREGDRLPTVAFAQMLLLERGMTDLAIDGAFGPETHRAVVRFQESAGLSATGTIESNTWAALSQGRSLRVVEAIDATDLGVLQEDAPYLRDGHAYVHETHGMSRGARTLIARLVASHPPGSVTLLRLHGHGGPGHMVVSSGTHAYSDTTFAGEHFVNPSIVAEYARLGTILAPWGSIEMHGCRVGARANGHRLLQGLSTACRVPVSAGVRTQLGGDRAGRFEGPVATYCPGGRSLAAWARTEVSRCAA